MNQCFPHWVPWKSHVLVAHSHSLKNHNIFFLKQQQQNPEMESFLTFFNVPGDKNKKQDQ